MNLRLILVSMLLLLACVVRGQCSVDFNYQQDVCSPTRVSFSANLPGVQSFLWNFGNSTTNSSSLNPVVTYATLGDYSVSLTATFTNGCTFTSTRLVSVRVQGNNALIGTDDTIICAGNSVQLDATGSAANFCWHDGSATISTTIRDITVSPSMPTTYYYTEQLPGGEAVVNGDFSAGNTGFSTDYFYCNSFQCISEGNYAIGPDAQQFHFDFRGTDHTTGTGNFLMANGMITANSNLWCQSVTVTPNSTYNFSMWLCTVAGEYAPAQLQLLINGQPVGGIAIAPGSIYSWIQHTASWNSGSATTANLCIVTVSDWFGGNDFGIDDISFGLPSSTVVMDSVFVDIRPPASANISYASPLCSSVSSPQPVTLTGTGTFTGGTFSAPAGLAINSATGAIIPSSSTPGTYLVSYNGPAINGCGPATATASVTINGERMPGFTIVPSICAGNSLSPLPTTSFNGITGSWSPTLNLSQTTTYTFTPDAGQCAASINHTIVVNPVRASSTEITVCTNALPYSWNGNSYPSGGTYSVTLTSSAGCDSIATLVLTANGSVTSTTNISVCNSQLPYSWNGNSYPSAGTYSVTLTSSAGCDSIATLVLTANSAVSSTTNISVCNNQLPYSWNGNSYPSAGTYSVTLTSSAGCDSIATLVLTANSSVMTTTNISVCNNQLPYSWNGNSYPSAGTYSVTLTSSAGCDSIATLVLTANGSVTSTTNISVCNNQLPYSWNGNSYPAAGTYFVTLTSGAGCDSIATLVLTANSAVSSTTNISVCNNQLPYSWNGNSYPSAGTYSVTLTSSAGCDSIASLILTANGSVTSTTNISVCNNQLPYSWNGNNYPSAGTYSVTLTSSAGCDSIATLVLTANGSVTSTTNISVCNNQLPYSWNGNNYPSAGTYSVTLTSSAGCDSITTLVLTANGSVTSTTNISVCNNQLPYSWNGNIYPSVGMYSITLTSSAGCDSIATLVLSTIGPGASTTTVAVCSNALPYTWNGNTYSSAGNYVVTLTGSGECDSLATLNLIVKPAPGLTIVSTPIVYCERAPTSALSATTGNPAAQLLWYNTPIGGAGSAIAPIPSSAAPGVTSYYVSQSVGGCEGPRAVITVRVNSTPDFDDQSLRRCAGESANLNALYNTSGLTTSWTFNQQPVTDVSMVNSPGNYQMIVETVDGCKDTASVQVTFNSPLFANAGDDADVETGVSFQLAGTGGQLYQWSPAAGLNNPFIPNPVATLSQDQAYVLTVQDDLGCLDTDTIMLRVLNGPTFYVPSAFTPNGDGLNDVFMPTASGILSLEFFRVYNRWGERVYETNQLRQGWDGLYRGAQQPIGDYVWELKGIDRKGVEKKMKGNVVLIR